MERSELEVGQKYQRIENPVIAEITGIGKKKLIIIVETLGPEELALHTDDFCRRYKPYKEPVIHKVWVHFYKNRYNNNNKPFFTVTSETPAFFYHNRDIYPHITLLKTVEVTYTEET